MESLGLSATDAEARDIVDDIDINKDGQIDFQGALPSAHYQDSRSKAERSKTEFLRAMAHPETDRALNPNSQKPDTKKEQRELLQAFKVFDRDGSGSISPEELRQALRQLGEFFSEEEINDMISHADLDGNGSIDCELLMERRES